MTNSIPKIAQPAPLTKIAPTEDGEAKKCGVDSVNHPSHYANSKIEPIDFIEDRNLNFNLGNVVKYISRCGKKKSKGLSAEAKALEDLKKARFYLEREIANREKEIK